MLLVPRHSQTVTQQSDPGHPLQRSRACGSRSAPKHGQNHKAGPPLTGTRFVHISFYAGFFFLPFTVLGIMKQRRTERTTSIFITGTWSPPPTTTQVDLIHRFLQFYKQFSLLRAHACRVKWGLASSPAPWPRGLATAAVPQGLSSAVSERGQGLCAHAEAHPRPLHTKRSHFPSEVSLFTIIPRASRLACAVPFVPISHRGLRRRSVRQC